MSNANEDRPIWLKSLADEDRTSAPPATLEGRLQNALRARRRRSIVSRVGMLALAASLCIIAVRISTIKLTVPGEASEEELAQAIGEASAWTGDDDPEFVPTRLAAEQPLEAVYVVRVSLTEGELAAYGVSSEPGSSGTEVMADLLVGQDGIPRAVRVVR